MAAKKMPAKKAMPAKKSTSSSGGAYIDRRKVTASNKKLAAESDSKTVPVNYKDATGKTYGQTRITSSGAGAYMKSKGVNIPKGKAITSIEMYPNTAYVKLSGEYAKGAKKGSITGKAKKNK